MAGTGSPAQAIRESLQRPICKRLKAGAAFCDALQPSMVEGPGRTCADDPARAFQKRGRGPKEPATHVDLSSAPQARPSKINLFIPVEVIYEAQAPGIKAPGRF